MYIKKTIPNQQLLDVFQGTQKRVRIRRGKRAIITIICLLQISTLGKQIYILSLMTSFWLPFVYILYLFICVHVTKFVQIKYV